MGINEATTAIGRVMMGISAERKWNRNTMITRLTMIASSIKSRCNVLIDS